MDSVNRHVVRDRIAAVVDVAVGAQGMSDGIKKHLRALHEAVGLRDPSVGSARDFLRRFGGGI